MRRWRIEYWHLNETALAEYITVTVMLEAKSMGFIMIRQEHFYERGAGRLLLLCWVDSKSIGTDHGSLRNITMLLDVNVNLQKVLMHIISKIYQSRIFMLQVHCSFSAMVLRRL